MKHNNYSRYLGPNDSYSETKEAIAEQVSKEMSRKRHAEDRKFKTDEQIEHDAQFADLSDFYKAMLGGSR